MGQKQSSTALEIETPMVRQFGEVEINLIPHDDDFWVTGESIGVALEYPEPRKGIAKVFQRHRQELQNHTCVVKMTTQVATPDPEAEGSATGLVTQGQDGIAQRRSIRLFNEEGVMIITMLSRQPKAAEFRAWAVQVLKAFRRGDLAVTDPREREKLHALYLKEAGRGNVAAMDQLIQHFGYRPEFKREQLATLAVLRGRNPAQMDLVLEGGDSHE